MGVIKENSFNDFPAFPFFPPFLFHFVARQLRKITWRSFDLWDGAQKSCNSIITWKNFLWSALEFFTSENPRTEKQAKVLIVFHFTTLVLSAFLLLKALCIEIDTSFKLHEFILWILIASRRLSQCLLFMTLNRMFNSVWVQIIKNISFGSFWV